MYQKISAEKFRKELTKWRKRGKERRGYMYKDHGTI